MKRFFIVFLAVIFFPLHVHGQLATVVSAPFLEELVASSHTEQLVRFGLLVDEARNQVDHLAKQGQMMADSLSRSILNIKKLGDDEIKDWDDFMEWYNRQLYMERQTQEAFERMNISIGGKTYSLFDVESMAYGVEAFNSAEYWTKEFTPEEIREIWLKLGLTPSNYAYVQTWKQKEMEIARKFLAMPGVQNNKYMQQMIRNSEFLKRLAGNNDLPEEDQLGEPELAAMNAEIAIDNNTVLHDIHMAITDLMELKAVEMYQARNRPDQPVLSEWPEDKGFVPLVD